MRRMRTEGSRRGLLSDVVTDRLRSLPEGSLRQAVIEESGLGKDDDALRPLPGPPSL